MKRFGFHGLALVIVFLMSAAGCLAVKLAGPRLKPECYPNCKANNYPLAKSSAPDPKPEPAPSPAMNEPEQLIPQPAPVLSQPPPAIPLVPAPVEPPVRNVIPQDEKPTNAPVLQNRAENPLKKPVNKKKRPRR